MDFLTALSIFVRVAESGSFSAVARERGVTQPAVSRQIAALEAYLGARLVNRTTRNVALTEDGRDFLGQAEAVLQAVEQAEGAVGSRQGGIGGLVRVSAPSVFGRVIIAPRIHTLLQRHSGLSVDLVLDDPTKDLVHEGVDLAIRVGELSGESSYIVRTIGGFSPVIVGAPSYLDDGPALAAPDDLSQHHCIMDDRAAHRETWTLHGPGGPIDVPVAGRLRSDSAEFRHEAVRTGLGLATLSKWMVRHDLRSGALRIVLPEWRSAPISVHAIYPSKRNLAPRVRAVLDFFLDQLKADPELSGLLT